MRPGYRKLQYKLQSPPLLPAAKKSEQMNSIYYCILPFAFFLFRTLMHEGSYTVPIGIAVQDGNYTGKTGATTDSTKNKEGNSRKNIVPLLHAFAKDFLRVRYMFWVNQEPYFEEDVLPCFGDK